MKHGLFFISLLLLGISFPIKLYGIPAFPGAEGFGAESLGGRGGAILKVINLNDSGPGSLREAVNANYPRIIVFEVSGILILNSELYIQNPYITIAGQTSPGGIMVAGRQVMIRTHDVIIQHMRFGAATIHVSLSKDDQNKIIYYSQPQYDFPPTGTGKDNCAGVPTTEALGYPCAIARGTDPETLDTFVIAGEYWEKNKVYNIMIDHCSFRWGVDETLSITGGVTNCTVQWSIVSEGLNKAGHPKGIHSKGLLVSGKYIYPNTVSLHHNYIAHQGDRSPLLYSPAGVSTVVDFVNNVVYNWYKGLAPLGEGTAKVNWVQNYAKPGPSSHTYSREVTHNTPPSPPTPLIYVYGNIGSTRISQSEPQWNVGDWFYDRDLDPAYQKLTPWTDDNGILPSVTTNEMSSEVAKCILSATGATAPQRDNVDTRVINDFSQGTGTILNNIKYPEDFPTYNTSLIAPADSDNDGMPDLWESQVGLNPLADDSSQASLNDGYTNIEKYLQHLSEISFSFNSNCMALPPGTPKILDMRLL